ncbi:unannotated protein [freshwater metagenome]|uniref:Unannotated protein n=1 Tax=freshwater metagenome TaxID=449393 RepID=A0A6J7GD52_9ZZZZ
MPVLLGAGIPFFGRLRDGPVRLEQTGVMVGHDVNHLRYRVAR